LRTLAILVGALLIPGAAFAVQQSISGANPKLAAMLEAKGKDGKPIITAEERTYFDGLNDNLKELLNQVVEKEIITRPEHLAVLLTLQLRPQKMELVLQNNCILCHTDSQIQTPDDLFTLEAPSDHSHMNLREVVDDVHFRRGLSCAGCHGGDPTAAFGHAFVKEWPEKDRQKDLGWIVYFCARCHSDPILMHQFNPALPTDQLAKYKDSPHGQTLLVKHDNRAPQCISCHGVHGIRTAKDPLSKVYPQHVPETCGACHANPKIMAGFKGPDGLPLPTNQLAEYKMSVHGRALLEGGDLGAPACNTCHGNHAAIPPGVSQVSRSCSLCHSANASLFDGSKHKQAFDSHGWPECGKCHGEHAIMKTHDSMLSTGQGGLCGDCHRQFAKNDPRCIPTANFFRETITKMADARKQLTAESEALAAKGLDVEPINNQLSDLGDSLKKSRTYIHSFSKDTFQQVAAPGEEAIQRTDALVSKAHGEYRFRQIGLGVSIALIGLLMLTIYLKLRQLEK
jgi:predicted CXXCH cytochrome family protein